LAVLVGSAEAVRPIGSLDELATTFDIAHLSRGAARFDEAEPRALSARFLHALPYEAAREPLAALEFVGAEAEPFWNAVRGNLTRFSEARDWWRVVRGEVAPVVEEPEFLAEAAACLLAAPWDATSWSVWTNVLKAASGRRGRALFHALRLALTGRESGPELAALLPLIGRIKA
jgi:glutamyl-tRNA synthetase